MEVSSYETGKEKNMRQILVYGDSLSWGIIPGTRSRLAFDKRWPGVLEGELNARGKTVRVIEDCLNGRRTVWDDPFKPGRNGLMGVEQRIEIHSPLALVVLVLGTNDFQSTQEVTAWHSAQGLAALVGAIRRSPVEPGMPIPEVLIVAPPDPGEPKGLMEPRFTDVAAKSRGFATYAARVAEDFNCAFFDGNTAAKASAVDGIHMDEDQHLSLGKALADPVSALLES